MDRLMNILKVLSLIILLCTSCICIGIEECPGDSIQIYKSMADSLIEVIFVPKATTPIYIFFAPNDIDTLSVFYQTVERDCCSDYDEIIKYKFNKVEYLYNNEAISFLK